MKKDSTDGQNPLALVDAGRSRAFEGYLRGRDRFVFDLIGSKRTVLTRGIGGPGSLSFSHSSLCSSKPCVQGTFRGSAR